MTVFFNEWFPSSIYGVDQVNVKAFGSIADANANLLSDLGFTSVANANAGIGGNGKAYPKATSLSDSADWCAIQSAVDYALANNIMKVSLPAGSYRTSDTIHLGYGMVDGGTGVHGGYSTILLEGAGVWATSVATGATRIISLFVDRPIINIQGSRWTTVRNLSVTGKPPSVGFVGNELAKKADPTLYVPVGAKTYNRAPYCGICLDGYTSGVYGEAAHSPPAQPYPTPRYPPWTPEGVGVSNVFTSAAAQATHGSKSYNKVQSSQCRIENVGISDCLVGIMQQPWYDVQCDYTKIYNCGISFCQVAIAIGNSQARNVDCSNLQCDGCYTVIDSSTYGPGNGNAQGTYDNMSMVSNYRIIHGAGGWAYPISFNTCYIENGMIIGDYTGNPMTFESCRFSCHDTIAESKPITITGLAWSSAGGGTATATCASLAAIGDIGWTEGTRSIQLTATPSGWNFNGTATWVDNTHFTYPLASNPGSFTSATCSTAVITEWRNEPMYRGGATFRNCSFIGKYVYDFPERCTFESCDWNFPYGDMQVVPLGMRKALYAFGHIFNGGSNKLLMTSSSAFRGTNAITGRSVFGRDLSGGTELVGTRLPFDGYNDSYYVLSMWGRGQKGAYIFDYEIPIEARCGIINILDATTPSAITLKFQFQDAPGQQEVGDVVLMSSGGGGCTWYSVEAIEGAPNYYATLRQMSNFKASSYVYTPIAANAGNLYWFPIGMLDLWPHDGNGLFMKTTVGQPTITFVNGNDSAVNTPTEIGPKSKPLWTNHGVDALYANTLPFPRHTYITSLTTTANSITMSQNAYVTGWWLYGPGIKKMK